MYFTKLQLLLFMIVILIISCNFTIEPMTQYYHNVSSDTTCGDYDNYSCMEYTGDCYGKNDGDNCIVDVSGSSFQGICHSMDDTKVYCLTTNQSGITTIDTEVSQQTEYQSNDENTNFYVIAESESNFTHSPYCEDNIDPPSNSGGVGDIECDGNEGCLCNIDMWNGVYTSINTDETFDANSLINDSYKTALFGNIPINNNPLASVQPDTIHIYKLNENTNGYITDRSALTRVYVPFSQTIQGYTGDANFTPNKGYYLNNHYDFYNYSTAIYPNYSESGRMGDNYYEECLYQSDSDGNCVCPENYKLMSGDSSETNPICTPCEVGSYTMPGRNETCQNCQEYNMVVNEQETGCVPCQPSNQLIRIYQDGECVSSSGSVVRSDCTSIDATVPNEDCNLSTYHLSSGTESLDAYYNQCNSILNSSGQRACHVIQTIYDENEGFENYNDPNTPGPTDSIPSIDGYDLYTNEICKSLSSDICDNFKHCELHSSDTASDCLLKIDAIDPRSPTSEYAELNPCEREIFVSLPNYNQTGEYQNHMEYLGENSERCDVPDPKIGYVIGNMGQSVDPSESLNVTCAEGYVGTVRGHCPADGGKLILTGCVSENTMNLLTLPKRNEDINDNSTLVERCNELCLHNPTYCRQISEGDISGVSDISLKYSLDLEQENIDEGCYLTGEPVCSGSEPKCIRTDSDYLQTITGIEDRTQLFPDITDNHVCCGNSQYLDNNGCQASDQFRLDSTDYILPEDLCTFRSGDNICYLDSCPISHPLNQVNDGIPYCFSCNNSNPFYDPQSNECLESCPGGQPYHNTDNICESCSSLDPGTPFYDLESNQCLESCPGSRPYYIDSGTEDKICIESCPIDQPYHNPDNICQSCSSLDPDTLFYDSESNQCLESCPADKPYHDDNNFCIESCPVDKPYHDQDNNCNEYCPDESPYSDESNNTCYSTCPINKPYFKNSLFYSDRYECLETCPASYFPMELFDSSIQSATFSDDYTISDYNSDNQVSLDHENYGCYRCENGYDGNTHRNILNYDGTNNEDAYSFINPAGTFGDNCTSHSLASRGACPDGMGVVSLSVPQYTYLGFEGQIYPCVSN